MGNTHHRLGYGFIGINPSGMVQVADVIFRLRPNIQQQRLRLVRIGEPCMQRRH